MTGYVVDASAIGPLIIPDEANNGHDFMFAVLAGNQTSVPQHWRLEVANLGRSAVRRQRLDHAHLALALAELSRFALEIDQETNQHAWGRSFELAIRHGLTPYDAAYLELAMRLGRTLVTNDRALIRAASAEHLDYLTQ